MPAIITDQFRILNAETFVKSLSGIGTTTNSYYTFLGHPNPTNNSIENYGSSDWSTNPPDPRDSFEQESSYHDSMLFLKKVNTSDVARVIPRYTWQSGITYDMYKNDYDITNSAPQTDAKSLYNSRYYVVNSEFKVYVCINNGSNPDYPNGQRSLEEPNFVDTAPQVAGVGADGYLWKYLYSLTPTEIIRFSTEAYVPVPNNWGTGSSESVKNAAVDGKIETIVIKNRGSGYTLTGGLSSGTVSNVPILGDGEGGFASVTITGGEVTNVQVTNGGSGYTRAILLFNTTSSGSLSVVSGLGCEFEVIIPPRGGHGYDVYRELGSHRVMVYSQFDSASDYIIGNNFSRIGIVKNPTTYGSETEILNSSTATSLSSLKLKPIGVGNTSDTLYPVNSLISQTVGVGSTAVGYVASWDTSTGVLRYYQPVGLSTLSNYNYKLHDFVSNGEVVNCSGIVGQALVPDSLFNTNTVTVGGRIINLGQTFTDGKSNPEVKRYSGEIIYIDNRAPITRSTSQKEEVKIVVEF